MSSPSTPTATASAARSTRLDSAGIAISIVCLLHCLALPVLVVLVPALDVYFPERSDHVVHWWLLAIAAPVSLVALGWGARNLGQLRWLLLGACGLVAMLAGVLHVFGAQGERAATAVGVTLLAMAHGGNWFAVHRSVHRKRAAP
jgi:hypothetical protein